MKLRKNKKKGFSLVELIVVIAIMAIMTAVLAPSLLSYVERSRAQKDTSAMSEVTNAIMLALADQNVYDEVLCYTAADNKSCYVDSLATYDASHSSYSPTKKSGETVLQYMFGDDARREDENPYAPAGVMRGVTITFEPEQSTNKSCFVLYNGIINKFGPTDFIYGEMPISEANDDGELLLGGMASFGSMSNHYLYNRIRSTVGDKIELTSQTYRNSEYTVFIRMGTTGGNQADKQDAIAVYGQWNGTNLSYGNNGTQQGGSTSNTPAIEIKPVFSENSIEAVIAACQAAAIDPVNNPIPSTWNVGDEMTIKMTIDGVETDVVIVIIGKNHEGETYGDTDANRAAGIVGKQVPLTFMTKQIVVKHNMNGSDRNEGGWTGSEMYTYLNDENDANSMFNALPEAVRNAIKGVNKSTNGGGYNGNATTAEVSVDKLFLLSVKEAGFDVSTWNTVYGLEGNKYEYFTTDNASRIKNYNGSASHWWLRSPDHYGSYIFYLVISSGDLGNPTAGYSHGAVFGFCF